MNVARLCSDLVSIRSENPPGDTRDVIEYIRGFTDALGIPTEVLRGPGGRDNLITRPVKGRLLFCGHVDVVPALAEGWDGDPFSGLITDEGTVFGRGATDMKGGCASILWACRTLVESGRTLPADLAFVCDEETSGELGVRRLLAENLLIPCDCIIAEPTPPLNPNIGQKGLMRLRLTFTGEPGHGSLYPVKGVSAIMEAYEMLRFLDRLHQKEYYPDDPETAALIRGSSDILRDVLSLNDAGIILTRLMYNPGMIEGGEKANIIAQRCTLELDLRIPWGCESSGLLDTIRAHAPRADVSEVGSSSGPSLTPAGSRLISRLLEEIGKVQGRPASPIVQWAASDARFLRKAGFQVVEYGPGEISSLHAVNEFVPVASLENAARVYQGMMERYGSGSD
jgi:succinyl-diaminopimelate desuccinylase